MELVSQGTANIFSSLFGGIPATGAIARTATNVKNGGRTPVAGMIHALTLLLIMVCVGRWAVLIPMATLAGILVVVAYNMSEWESFISVTKGPRSDIAVTNLTVAAPDKSHAGRTNPICAALKRASAHERTVAREIARQALPG